MNPLSYPTSTPPIRPLAAPHRPNRALSIVKQTPLPVSPQKPAEIDLRTRDATCDSRSEGRIETKVLSKGVSIVDPEAENVVGVSWV